MDATPRPSDRWPLLDAVLAVHAGLDLPTTLDRIVRRAVELVDARYGALGVLDEAGTGLAQFLTVGLDDAERAVIGTPPEGHGILGLLIRDARPIRLPDLTAHPESFGFPPGHPPMRSFLGVPVLVRGHAFGNLYLTDKTTGPVFTDEDEELVVGLAAAAGLAIDNARLHQRLQAITVVEERERIGRDLHDTVIQRLYATGLSLQGTTRLADDDAVRARLDSAIEELDATVKMIRSVIFDLEVPEVAIDSRQAFLSTVRSFAATLGFGPELRIDGPAEIALDADVAVDLLATVREALTNVVRHAHADTVLVELVVGDDVALRVTDDGVGPGRDPGAGRGLGNLRYRAERHGGTMALTPASPRGSTLEWRVPRR